MLPILFELGPLKFYAFGTCLAVGTLSALLLLNFLTQKNGLKMAFIYDYLLLMIFGMLVTSRMTHVFLKWNWYGENLKEILYVFDGGFSFWGAICGGLVIFYYLCFRHSQNELIWLDNIIIPAQIVNIFGFLGFFLSEEGLTARALGTPTDLPFGLSVNLINSPFSFDAALHPLALYFVFSSFINFILLFLVRRYTRKPGLAFFSGTLFFCLTAYLIESLKWQIRYDLFGFNFDQMMSLIFIILSLAGFFYVFIKSRQFQASKKL